MNLDVPLPHALANIKLLNLLLKESNALFAWLINHRPAVLFSKKSEQTSHQQPAKRTGCQSEPQV
jgi:hypothetical protein